MWKANVVCFAFYNSTPLLPSIRNSDRQKLVIATLKLSRGSDQVCQTLDMTDKLQSNGARLTPSDLILRHVSRVKRPKQIRYQEHTTQAILAQSSDIAR